MDQLRLSQLWIISLGANLQRVAKEEHLNRNSIHTYLGVNNFELRKAVRGINFPVGVGGWGGLEALL